MGSSISSTARADVDRGRYGHSYSEMRITGNARAHNGDVYNIRNFYSPWPDALSREVSKERPGIPSGHWGNANGTWMSWRTSRVTEVIHS
jgi:hypothetical protein